MNFIIDFCHEEDGYVHIDSPDLADFIRKLPRNVAGKITVTSEEFLVDYEPCTEDE